jgi:hypothetical protein
MQIKKVAANLANEHESGKRIGSHKKSSFVVAVGIAGSAREPYSQEP